MTDRLRLEEVPFPGPWWRQGACRGVPTEMFFPGRGDATEPAKLVCQRCPVLAECRDYAVPVGELKGIWGGLAEVQRKRLRAKTATAPQPRPKAPIAPSPPVSQPQPAPAGPGQSRRSRRGGLYRALEELTTSPGRSARVAWYPGPHTAAGMATRLANGWISVPVGAWQFEAGPSDDGGSALWALYLGPAVRRPSTGELAS